MGIGPDALHALNPKLIIVRVSGWGQDGPYRDKPGFGSLVEGMSGFAAKNGFADRPPVLPPLALADMIAGLYGANAVLIALREIEQRGGTGQVIDLPLLDPIFSILGPEAAIYQLTQKIEPRVGSRSNNTAPRNVYETKDGRFISISASIQTMAERLFRAIGRADMIDDPRFRTNTDRVRNIDECDRAGRRIHQGAHARRRPRGVRGGRGHRRAGLRHRPVHRRPACAGARDRDRIARRRDGQRCRCMRVVPRLSGTPGEIRTPAPALGEHNDEILGGLGFERRRHRRFAQAEGDMSDATIASCRSGARRSTCRRTCRASSMARTGAARTRSSSTWKTACRSPSGRRRGATCMATAENVARGGADVIVRINRPWRQTMLDLEAAIRPRVTGARRHQGGQRRPHPAGRRSGERARGRARHGGRHDAIHRDDRDRRTPGSACRRSPRPIRASSR